MERKIVEVEPIENQDEIAEYIILKIDIKNGFFISEDRMERFQKLDKKFGDKIE
jgi:hypothetical protein